ncbi:hypothetical protein V8E53_007484 [Lactarius tabidus]|jgi:hypothetical protein
MVDILGPTAVALLCGVVMLAGRHRGITGPTGSSLVPPPLFPLSEAVHEEIRSPMTAPSPVHRQGLQRSAYCCFVRDSKQQRT